MDDNERIIPKNVKNHVNDSAENQTRTIHGVPITSKYPGKEGLEDCLSDRKTKKSFVDQISNKKNTSNALTEQEAIAIAEVMYYLRGIKQCDIDKIPQDFVDFLYDNVAKEHKSSFDNSFPLQKIDMSDEARGIIGMICSNYWCEDEDQKKEYLEHISHNELEPNDIDDDAMSDTLVDDNKEDESLVNTQKIKWYQKISNFFSKLFKKK